MAGQGNDSQKAKNYLINLSPNIQVIRHPNKLFGPTKAVLWSHHEKLVIIDRSKIHFLVIYLKFSIFFV